jgi:dCTP deaminase
MILPAQHIRARCAANPPLISPFNERSTAEGLTYGLSPAGYDVRIDQDVTVAPTSYRGSFQLASTIERFTMPNDLMAIVHDKSTWARQGLVVQNTVIEPGWSGFLTLELSNCSDQVIMIRRGTPIAQIVFHMLVQATEQVYEGRYQNQDPGPQQARLIRETE